MEMPRQSGFVRIPVDFQPALVGTCVEPDLFLFKCCEHLQKKLGLNKSSNRLCKLNQNLFKGWIQQSVEWSIWISPDAEIYLFVKYFMLVIYKRNSYISFRQPDGIIDTFENCNGDID